MGTRPDPRRLHLHRRHADTIPQTMITSRKLKELGFLAIPGNPVAKRIPPAHDHKTDSVLPDPEPERDQTPALDCATAREAEGDARTLVRFTGYRVRPLDPDNFAGSVKDLLDGLRLSGLISGDEPWRIRLETEQVRVGTFKEERTEIEIITP